jgi:phage gp45-like
MEQWDLEKIIRNVIKQELAGLIMGTVTDSASSSRASAQRFPGENPVTNQRIISPFGLASRPSDGTQVMMGAINGDPTHLNILGCNDTARPGVNKGESILYGADGQVIYMKAGGSIHQGTKGATEPVVLGNVLKEFLTTLINQILNSPQIGFDAFGLPVAIDPQLAINLLNDRIQYLDTPSSNIVGQKNFVERGA